MKKLSIFLLSSLLFFTVTGCSTQGNNPYAGTPDEDMVTVNLATEPPTLNTILSGDSASTTILDMTMSGLVKYDGSDTVVPDIASSWEVSDDKKTFTFTLRDDATWSNGDAVTAHDFIFGWKQVLDSKNASPMAEYMYKYIKGGAAYYEGTTDESTLGIKAINDKTLEVELENQTPYEVAIFSSPLFYPVNEKFYSEVGAENYAKDVDKLITNGPYTITEWVHDDHILVEKDEKHFDAETIFVPKVKYVMISDMNAAMSAFKAGQLDGFNIFGDQITQLEGEGSDIVKSYFDNAVFTFQYNMSKKETGNANINRALAMAIDVQSLCDNVFKDGSLAANGIVAPGINGADGKKYAEVRGNIFEYNQKEAKELLETGLTELGMTAAEYKISYVAYDSEIGRLQAEYFKEQWKVNLGIDVTIELIPFNAYVERLSANDFDITCVGWASDFSNPIGYFEIMSSNNGNNYGKYNNPEFDELINQAFKEMDDKKRQDLVIQAEKIVMDDGALLPIYHTRVVYATSNKISGLNNSALQRYNFTNGAKIEK